MGASAWLFVRHFLVSLRVVPILGRVYTI